MEIMKKILIGVGIAFFIAIAIILTIDLTVSYEEVEVNKEAKKTKNYFLGKDISDLFVSEGSIDLNSLGEYKVKYKFLGCPLIYKVKKFKVIDSTKPELKIEGKEEYELLGDIKMYKEPGYTSIDNYDGDITDKVERHAYKLDENKYKLTYTSTDSSGNSSTIERKINLIKGIIYLTFDDGPSIENTTIILDTLKEKDVKATFFVINYSKEKENILKREYNEGHTVGLHGFSHTYSEIYNSIDTIMNNFYKIRDKVYGTTGYNSKYIRFPGGGSNTISRKYCPGIMTEATKRVIDEGFRYYDWNVDVDDAGRAKTSDEIYQNFVTGIKTGRENIVLLHDSEGHRATADAVSAIVEYGLKNGYEFRNITDDTALVTHSVNN